MNGWSSQRDDGACGTRTRSLASVLRPRSVASSAIPRRGSSSCAGGKKTACGCCGRVQSGCYDRRKRRVRDLCGDPRVYLEFEIRRVDCRRCGAVKRERLRLVGRQPLLHQAVRLLRRAGAVGPRRSGMWPRELRLDWKTVKELEKQYMREQLRRAGTPGPKVIGIDEISIGKGHNYRIVVSDLARPADLVRRHGPLRGEHGRVLPVARGRGNASKIRLAVMDMWKPFRNSTLKAGNAPQAGILYDKFHILQALERGLGQGAQERVRPLSGKDRRFIKGQKYTLLSSRANLAGGAQALEAAVQGQQDG